MNCVSNMKSTSYNLREVRMGSRSAAKSGRNKAIAGPSKGPTKSGTAGGKQSQSEEAEELEDLSVLRKSVGTSVNGLIHALKVFQTGTEEIRSLLSQECKVIYECRVCDNLFRSLANFLSHKRIYCKGVASAVHPSSCPPCQPNGLLPHGGRVAAANGTEPQPDGSLEMVIVEPEPPPKRQRTESPEHWLCNESTPVSDGKLVGPLPKLQVSVPPIRRRKDICGVIEKLSRRASRQNLANATAVASHIASFTGGQLCLDNAVTTSTSNALYMENISETKQAVYQTLLCASSSSMKLSFPPSGSEHSTVPHLKGEVGCGDAKASPMPSDYVNPSFPPPHSLLIKNRVALMKEAISQGESGVLGPDGILIPSPPKANGPTYPPEVCSGGVSNSEGEEVEDDDEDGCGEVVAPRGAKSKALAEASKAQDEKEEIICSICKAKFSTRKTLSHHMKSLHVMFRTYYRCPCCKTCFANNWSVYRHLYKVHRKTTDQVRKLRALIKKKAFRKKIILPLPNQTSEPAKPQPVAKDRPKHSAVPVAQSTTPEKATSPPAAKSSTSSTTSSKIVSSGRSGSPLPPPTEATQFPAISAQHAQVLRKLENIVKEDNNWRLESFPERPGMGQSCPGCNRRFERRAALASHAHSCHKRILLAAQKASRARNKQQQQKMGKGVVPGTAETAKNDKGLLKSKEAASGKEQVQGKPKIESIKLSKNQAGVVTFQRGTAVKKEENSSEEEEVEVQGSSSYKTQNVKPSLARGIDSRAPASHYKALPEVPFEKFKEEESEEIERPSSAASSFGTHRDSCSPLTIPTHPGRQQRIGIQIRKDYVKGDRVSVCSSGPTPPPYPPLHLCKEEDEADEDVVVLDSKDAEAGGAKESAVPGGGEENPSSDPDGGSSANTSVKSSFEGRREDWERGEEEDDEEGEKVPSVGGESNFQSEEEGSSGGEEESAAEGKETQGSAMSSGEVKRVFLELIVGGVADPNSLAVDEEDGEGKAEDSLRKEGKQELPGRRGPSTRGKPSALEMSSSQQQQRQGGRPVRNRVKVEREDFIYDLSDMKLSPTKKDDACATSSFPTSKKTRRNVGQVGGGVGQSSNGSSVRQMLVPGMIKVEGGGRAQCSSVINNDGGGHPPRVYSGKAMGGSLPADKSVNKVPVSAKGGSYPAPVASQKGDCRVVIGGLRSGDMTQLSVRRVYSSSRKALSPSRMAPMAVESEETGSCGNVSDIDDDGLFAEVSEIEAAVMERSSGKTSSLLYQSDSLDSGESLSDYGGAAQVNSPVDSNELNPTS
ncbi:uncharacterized protein LOC124164345 isoform X2 [Ischnura elegans]|uniref:uncharacterized protein LOC124164345 isoform X2 n=1 Tax=Ischnura elegans TaxID=197161 RepID=UPI001ED8AFFF|nr:uncharacterized protein LOC124164345 isoform X2 [Ischnura elegans]